MASISNYLNRKVEATPTQEVGIGGFTALVRTKERCTLTADVPAIPVEDGSFVSDHIIYKPTVLRIEGNVSDVHLRASPAIRQLQRVQAEIGNVVAQYGTAHTVSQLQRAAVLANTAADAIRRIDNLLDTGAQALDFFGNKDTSTKTIREQFIDSMEALFYGGVPITIDMPYQVFNMMVITSFVASYDNEEDTTNFTLEARQIQLAEVQSVKIAKAAPGTGGQTEAPVNKGAQEGTPVVEASLLSDIFSAATGAE